MYDLTHEVAHTVYLRERIRAEFPDIDEVTLGDTVSGETNLDEALAAVARQVRLDELTVEAIEKRITEMSSRADRHQARINKGRELIAAAMERAGLKKVPAADVTISLRPVAPKLLLLDEEAVPDAYKVTPAPKVDKAALKAALGEGKAIPGATLSNGGVTASLRFK
jgi:hypothetical protein